MLKVHMSLPVRDVAATRAFYEALFRSEPVKAKPDYLKFEPDDLALNISFVETDRPVDTDRHLGIQYASQTALDEAFTRLQSDDLVHGERESSICCYADQDKFHVRDPDGYEWELYYLLSDSEIKIQADTNCCEAGAEADGASCC